MSARSAHDNMDVYNQYAGNPNQKVVSGKKKDDNYTEDSSVYVHGDEFTNANNINSNRHDINFEGIDQISDDENL